jgi:hypothetical protein
MFLRRGVILLAIGVGGCASQPHEPRGTVHDPVLAEAFLSGRPTANLVLGPSPRTGQIAETLAQRSSWPAVENGYRFDEMTYFSEYTYDDQSFYDYWGGAFISARQTIRTGVSIR